jgi:Arc/MetJ-type ribon-helix-helix transcriptional regulator
MKQISISLGESYISQIDAISVKKEISRSDVVRRALDLYWKKEMGDEARQPAPSKLAKQAREEAYARLIAMNDEDMTNELDRIGAFQKNWVNGAAIGQTYISRNENEVRCIRHIVNGKPGGFDVPAFDALMNKIKNNLKEFYPLA